MFIQGRRGADPEPGVVEALRQASPSTYGHRTDLGFVRGLTTWTRRVRLAGPALTVHLPHLDSTALHCALDLVHPGDVVVVDQSGDLERASWGGGVSYAAKARGAAGAVVDGAITDIAEIEELEFPIFYRSISALTTRILGIEGAINVPVQVGGVVVHPGDLVFADENGVAILAPAGALELARSLTEREAGEGEMKRKLDAGASLADLSGARKLFEAKRQPPESA
ncbi:MAG: RraA family protein [Candidatus Dormibacteraceae bacterium]